MLIFHEIKRKSKYYGKYHVKNSIDEITSKNNIKLTYEIGMKINRIVHLTRNASPQVNENRKRTIPINYIVKQIFPLLEQQHEGTQITKSKKTLLFYHECKIFHI